VISVLIGFTLVLSSCGGAAPASEVSSTEPRLAVEPPSTPRRTSLDLEGVDGLSGLTVDAAGVFWAVPERNHVLVAFRGAEVLALVRLEGFPEEADAESIAYLGEGRFAIGTESTDETRASDHVYLVQVDGELPNATARVTSQIELPYAVLSVSPAHNKGIEGLCAVGETVVAAVEPKLTREDGVCTTALARGDLASGSWSGHDVELTTETGKISALACRTHDDGGIEVFAVERHYEVMRILRFVVPEAPGDSAIVPELLADLAGTLEGDPNLEGLAIDGSDFVIINDNHYGERSGPNEVVRIALPAGSAWND
jgi:hypothetical protein